MSITTRKTGPTAITQGEKVTWTITLDDYPADEYTLSYRFRGQNGPGLNVTAVADGEEHDVTLTAAQTEALAAGRFDWQAWVTKISDATDTKMIDRGRIEVKQGFKASGTLGKVDMRSPAKICLDSIDAALQAFATSDIIEYEISTPAGSRKVKRAARGDLMDMRKLYAGIVAREAAVERARNGGAFGQRVEVRMYDE